MLASRRIQFLSSGALFCAGCIAPAQRFDEGCDPSQPKPGTVRVETILCYDLGIPGGDGGIGDIWIATPNYRAIIRGPQASLTSPGASGGTLIDLAPWDERDTLHEVIPNVAGGWLDVIDVVVDETGVTLTGTPEPLLGRGDVNETEKTSVTWKVDPQDPWLRVSGAQGLWFHGHGEGEWLGGRWHADETVIATDGDAMTDQGGPTLLNDTTALLVGHAEDTYRLVGEVSVSGLAPRAEALELFEQDQRVGLLPLRTERFDTRVPGGVDGVRAIAEGYRPSPLVAPTQDLNLALGASGAIRIQPRWDSLADHPISVRWTVDDRSGETILPSSGGLVSTGPGEVMIELSAGRTYTPIDTTVIVADDGAVGVSASWAARWDPGDWVPASLQWPSDRSHAWRGSDAYAAAQALSEGFRFVVNAPLHEVSGASGETGALSILQQRGSRLVTDSGAQIVSWPWTPQAQRAGHGAIDPRGLSAVDALASSAGGPGKDRRTMVDLAWLSEVGAPYTVGPTPWFVQLRPPIGLDPTEAWLDWFRWLDAGVTLSPVGPVTWVQVPDAQRLGLVDVETGLIAGAVSAGTGPLVSLRVEGAHAGEVAPAQGRWPPLSFEAQLMDIGELDQAALIVNGDVHQRWDLTDDNVYVTGQIPDDTRWVLLTAWNIEGTAWTTSGAIWRDPP